MRHSGPCAGRGMFDPGATLAAGFAGHLAGRFVAQFPAARAAEAALLRETAGEALARLRASDALYHTAEHTMMVTLAGLEILAGRGLAEPLAAADGLHYLMALLLHDIGFAPGACAGDEGRRRVIDAAGATVELGRGASDATLQPWHVARAMIHVRERYGGHPLVDAGRLAAAIRLTRFPVPAEPGHADAAGEPGLVRAADLIGQLADPRYLLKTHALYHELAECGLAEPAGYRCPADVIERFPAFFRASVAPWLGPALAHLGRTAAGRDWIARLDAHLREAERRAAGAPAAADAPGRWPLRSGAA